MSTNPLIDLDRLNDIDNRDSLLITDKALKLGEESGEVVAEILAFLNKSNASASAKGTKEGLAEEVIDVIIVAESILKDLSLTRAELRAISDRKLNKWEAKLHK